MYVIPARGGSKGIPGKNIKPLAGKPLIVHTLELARSLASDDDICVTTDDNDIIKVLEAENYQVPFVRPVELAQDTSSSYDVIKHAVEFYESNGNQYDAIVLLQPTSPFRRITDVQRALEMYTDSTDLVVSCQKVRTNPYYAVFKVREDGLLEKFLSDSFTRRQDLPQLVEWNGAVYVISIDSLKRCDSLLAMNNIKMVEMDEIHSWDLDTMTDWIIAEALIEKDIVSC